MNEVDCVSSSTYIDEFGIVGLQAIMCQAKGSKVGLNREVKSGGNCLPFLTAMFKLGGLFDMLR